MFGNVNWKIPFMVVAILVSAMAGKYYDPEVTPLSVETQVSAQTEGSGVGQSDPSDLVFFGQAAGTVRERTALKTGPDGIEGRVLGVNQVVEIGGSMKNGVLGGTYYWVRIMTPIGLVGYGFLPQKDVVVMSGRVPELMYHAAPEEAWLKPFDSEYAEVTGTYVESTDQGDPIVLAQSVDGADAVSIAWLPAPVRSWADLLNAAAATHGVSADLLAIITLCESGGHPSARSHVGATGLMQVMPATAGDIARQRGMGAFDSSRLNEPEVGIDFGAWYLAQQLKAFGQADDPDWNKSVELAAVAYNGGPGTAQKYVRSGALPNETSFYQRWVGGMWRERHDATSPTYEAWLAAGGQVLVDKAEAWLNGQQVSMVR